VQRRSNFRSGFFSAPVLIAPLLCTVAFSILTRCSSAFVRSEAPTRISHQATAGLTFAERVAYQRVIEEVYWRHRIWPKERRDPKPSLDAVMSRAQLEKKVTDHLRESQALEDDWQRPITAEQLQTEMDRMAKHTRQPEVLRELFDALGNNPFVIAECLVRPVLSKSLVRTLYEHDQRLHGELEPPAESWRRSAETQTPDVMAAARANYSLPTISGGPDALMIAGQQRTSPRHLPDGTPRRQCGLAVR
jgi:hypothetical protein